MIKKRLSLEVLRLHLRTWLSFMVRLGHVWHLIPFDITLHWRCCSSCFGPRCPSCRQMIPKPLKHVSYSQKGHLREFEWSCQISPQEFLHITCYIYFFFLFEPLGHLSPPSPSPSAWSRRASYSWAEAASLHYANSLLHNQTPSVTTSEPVLTSVHSGLNKAVKKNQKKPPTDQNFYSSLS